MDTIEIIATSVTGARHLRVGRNGQDAAASWGPKAMSSSASDGTCREHVQARVERVQQRRSPSCRPIAVVVVCDGCSAGASSEVGARLGASLFAAMVGRRLASGEPLDDETMWSAARRELVSAVDELVGRMTGAGEVARSAIDELVGRTTVAGEVARSTVDELVEASEVASTADQPVDSSMAALDETHRLCAIHDHFLFTIVAAAITPDAAAVWILGDGVYAFDDRVHTVGPFADNQPPYLAYDLLGEPRDARLHVAPPGTSSIVIATDGATDLDIRELVTDRFLAHPDALRRHLAVLARATERIDWSEQRVARTPAVLQDDCAVAILRRRP